MNKNIILLLKKHGFVESRRIFVSDIPNTTSEGEIAMSLKTCNEIYLEFKVYQMRDGSFLGSMNRTWFYGKTFNEFMLNSIIDIKLILVQIDSSTKNPFINKRQLKREKDSFIKVFKLLKKILLSLTEDIDIQ